MGKLLCEKNVRDVWCRNESVRVEIGPILQTHTHTRVSYSSIDFFSKYFLSLFSLVFVCRLSCNRNLVIVISEIYSISISWGLYSGLG